MLNVGIGNFYDGRVDSSRFLRNESLSNRSSRASQTGMIHRMHLSIELELKQGGDKGVENSLMYTGW